MKALRTLLLTIAAHVLLTNVSVGMEPITLEETNCKSIFVSFIMEIQQLINQNDKITEETIRALERLSSDCAHICSDTQYYCDIGMAPLDCKPPTITMHQSHLTLKQTFDMIKRTDEAEKLSLYNAELQKFCQFWNFITPSKDFDVELAYLEVSKTYHSLPIKTNEVNHVKKCFENLKETYEEAKTLSDQQAVITFYRRLLSFRELLQYAQQN